MGEAHEGVLRPGFDRRLKLEFRRTKLQSEMRGFFSDIAGFPRSIRPPESTLNEKDIHDGF
jgi:hypothetical protein